MESKDASLQSTTKEKRDAEGDGRDLLVAYLSDVGGYDRNYRDVGDEDENSSLGRNANISKPPPHRKKKKKKKNPPPPTKRKKKKKSKTSDNVLIRGG